MIEILQYLKVYSLPLWVLEFRNSTELCGSCFFFGHGLRFRVFFQLPGLLQRAPSEGVTRLMIYILHDP